MGGGNKNKKNKPLKKSVPALWGGGKYRILAKIWTSGVRSEWFVFDLKRNMVVMKHPHAVWSGETFDSRALLQEGTLYVFNIGVEKYNSESLISYLPPIRLNQKQDYIHSSDYNSCTSTLDLTTSPPTWSNWTPTPKMFTSSPSVDLRTQLLQFHLTWLQVYLVFHDQCEEITIPFYKQHSFRFILPIADPKNNRILVVFVSSSSFNKGDFLYAYYPYRDKSDEQWELLHHHDHDHQRSMFRPALSFADQLVGDSLILCYDSSDALFMAYNIVTHNWLGVDADPLFNYDPSYRMCFWASSTQLLHLGDNIFCLVNSSYHTEAKAKAVTNFLRFSADLVQQQQQQVLRLTHLSVHHIPITHDVRNLPNTFIPF